MCLCTQRNCSLYYSIVIVIEDFFHYGLKLDLETFCKSLTIKEFIIIGV